MTTVMDNPRTDLRELYPKAESADSEDSEEHSGGKSITVIENPLVEGNTGFLLSAENDAEEWGAQLFYVSHFRVGPDGKKSSGQEYNSVSVIKRSGYSFVMAGTRRLPMPSARPYETVPVGNSDFSRAKNLLDNPTTFGVGVELVYQLLAKKQGIFKFNGNGLEMPKDYASLRLRR